MTNAELIQKIRNEIERLKKNNEIFEDKDYAQYELDGSCGYNEALNDMLSFLSSLELEKPMNQDGLNKEIENCLWKLSDDPSNEELRMFARHFAQWGAEWQAKQDQETIELAEDHAYLAGAVNEREKMMKEAVGATVHLEPGANPIVTIGVARFGLKVRDKVKVIIVKEEN